MPDEYRLPQEEIPKRMLLEEQIEHTSREIYNLSRSKEKIESAVDHLDTPDIAHDELFKHLDALHTELDKITQTILSPHEPAAQSAHAIVGKLHTELASIAKQKNEAQENLNRVVYEKTSIQSSQYPYLKQFLSPSELKNSVSQMYALSEKINVLNAQCLKIEQQFKKALPMQPINLKQVLEPVLERTDAEIEKLAHEKIHLTAQIKEIDEQSEQTISSAMAVLECFKEYLEKNQSDNTLIKQLEKIISEQNKKSTKINANLLIKIAEEYKIPVIIYKKNENDDKTLEKMKASVWNRNLSDVTPLAFIQNPSGDYQRLEQTISPESTLSLRTPKR